MKALVLDDHGGNDRLRFDPDYRDPTAGEGQVVVAVKACSLNYHDIFTRRGMPGIKVPLPLVMGIDVAGVVESVGPGVEGWVPGDRVLVDPFDAQAGVLVGEMVDGGLAERCVLRAAQLLRLPATVDFPSAAALPVAFGTAHRMLRTIGRIERGERVLILGASGGVGVASLLLAKLAGAEVVACAGSAEKARRLRELGADDTIDYTAVDFAKEVQRRFGKPQRFDRQGGVDVVVNFTGGDTWVPSLKCLRRGGRMLTCGATAGYDPKTDLRYLWSFELEVRGSNGWTRDDLHALIDLVGDRALPVPVDQVYPLEEGAAAFEALESRRVLGKLVVAP
jgi:NADPH:quinone reductase-like Zn-dependent oxidoreductase